MGLGRFPPGGKEKDLRRPAQDFPGTGDLCGEEEQECCFGLAESAGEIVPPGMAQDLLRIPGRGPGGSEENSVVESRFCDVLDRGAKQEGVGHPLFVRQAEGLME